MHDTRGCRDLVNSHQPENMVMYVAKDSVVCVDQVVELCTQQSTRNQEGAGVGGEGVGFRAVLVVIPVRAGLDKLNPVYVKPIIDVFKLPHTLGIVGGKPNASLYIVATQGMPAG